MQLSKSIILILVSVSSAVFLSAQATTQVGTTATTFLEIGMGSAANSMGEAYVAMADDATSVYWNPAGLAFMKNHEAVFMYQPYVVDIGSVFASVGLVSSLGTFGLSLTQFDYGDIEVTDMDHQDGTGETYSPNEFTLGLSYARKIVPWFAFGASAKLVHSKIWHCDASAFALDLGAVVNTDFFSPTGEKEQGMKIGMSISNYGTRMRYEGIDLLELADIEPNENGNADNVPVQFKTQEWELPLIFRIGVALKPIWSESNRLTLAIDALHPNNNNESVNTGAQYELRMPGTGSLYLRAGYKALFMDNSEHGLTFGAGIKFNMMNNAALKVDYSYKELGILGDIPAFTVGVVF